MPNEYNVCKTRSLRLLFIAVFLCVKCLWAVSFCRAHAIGVNDKRNKCEPESNANINKTSITYNETRNVCLAVVYNDKNGWEINRLCGE